MSASAPFPSISLRDTLTRVIPGLVILSMPLISAAVNVPGLLPSGGPFILGVALLSYLIGEVVDQLRSGTTRVPQSFRHFIYKKSGQLDKMPLHYRWIVDKQERLPERFHVYEEIPMEDLLISNFELDFREDMESQLGVDFDENRPRDIYDLFLMYMDTNFTRRMRRQQSLAIFSSNLRISAAIASLFYLYAIIVDFGSLFSYISAAMFLLILFVMITGWSVLTMTQNQYGELLLKAYYAKRHSELSDQN